MSDPDNLAARARARAHHHFLNTETHDLFIECAAAHDASLARIRELEQALEEIAEGKGRYAHDQFVHACNTIEDMKEIARAALSRKATP